MNNLSGLSLGRYHITEKLGEGGMAFVYKAYDTHLECDVAVKVIRTDQLAPAVLERTMKRFEREAKEVAKLNHPNIVRVMDYGEYKGVPYLVMPYLHGGTLKQRLGTPMPYQEAASLLRPIARALEYAHQHKMIHRDVKPSNILITDSGDVMLTDFGIVKMLDVENGNTLTGTGMGLGTPEYMAPEQWVGESSPAVDQYSLGVVFFELITGHKPYSADTPAAVLIKQASEPLPRPVSFISDLPENVERFLFKTLAKNPADRFPSMEDFAHSLRSLRGSYPSDLSPLGLSIDPEKTSSLDESYQATVDNLPTNSGSPSSPQTSTYLRHFSKKQLLLSGGIALLLIAISLFLGKCFIFDKCFTSKTSTVLTESESTLDVNEYWASINNPTSTVNPSTLEEDKGKTLIGLSFSDFATERWKPESELLTKLLEEKGYKVVVQEANHDVKLQNDQIDNMVAQGAKGLIIIAEDGTAVATAVDKAATAGVKVLAYDRLIKSTNIAAYLSFDNTEVGRQQALGIMTTLGLPGSTTWTKDNPAKIVLSGGSPTDNNAHLVRNGQMEIIQPYINEGIIKVVADFWVENWDAANALKNMENALTAQQNNIDAVIASNDSTALGELQALKAQGLASKVLISGQDATAESCNSILKGEQTMTILKDFRLLAPLAVNIIDDLIQEKTLTGVNKVSLQELTGDNLSGTLDCIFLPVVQITKENIFEEVVVSGFLPYDDVYRDIPLDQLPSR